jgi:hypothetical protein
MPLDFTTALFARDPLGFLRANAISPPARENPRLMGEKTIPHAQKRFKSAQVEVPIAWIRLFDDLVYPGACTFDLEFPSGDVASRINRADRLPVYYLPWEPDKFVRVSIPAYRADREGKFADFGIGTDHSGKTFARCSPLSGLSLRWRRQCAQPTGLSASGQRALAGLVSHHHADHRAAAAGENFKGRTAEDR